MHAVHPVQFSVMMYGMFFRAFDVLGRAGRARTLS
jgi:hypothetical protein